MEGPQEERSRVLEQEGRGLRSTDRDYQEQVARLRHKLAQETERADRAFRELRRYQQIVEISPTAAKAVSQQATDDRPLPPWCTQMELLSPLCIAYDDRIQELEDESEERRIKLAELLDKVKYLVKENETLRTELRDKVERMLQESRTRAEEPSLLTDDRAELQELYQLTADQNAVLTRQTQVLKEQLGKTEVAVKELHSRSVAAAKSAEEWRDRAQSLESSLRQAEDQRSAAQRRVGDAQASQAHEAKRADQLSSELERTREELTHSQQQSVTFKAALERTCTEAKEDAEKLRAEVHQLAQDLDGAQAQASLFESQVAEHQDRARIARRESDVMKQESEQMLKLMESMERKLRDVTEGQEAATTRAAQLQQKVDALELQIDEATATAHAAKLAAERSEERRVLETTALQQSVDDEVRSCARHLGAAQKLREVETQLEAVRGDAQEARMAAEEAEGKLSLETGRLARQVSVLETEKVQLESNCAQLHEARLSAEQRYDEAVERLAKAQADISRQAEEMAMRVDNAEAAAIRARSDADSATTALHRSEQERQHVEAQLQELASVRDRLTGELSEAKRRAADALTDARARAKAEATHAEQKLRSLVAQVREAEDHAAEAQRSAEDTRVRVSEELARERQDKAQSVASARAEADNLRQRNQTLVRVLTLHSLEAPGI
jgi:chromosome segregation ATPase